MASRSTQTVKIDPAEPDPAVLRFAASILQSGGLVAFPTETVYGLGASALDSDAVRSIFEAKGRPPNNPLIVHISDDRMLRRVIAAWPEHARKLANRYWPGPLTFVLPRKPGVPLEVTAGGPTVAVRMPAHPVALGLIRETGVPLAAPSANRSSQLSPTRAEHVIAGLGGRIDLVLDGGPTASGIESTVLDLSAEPPTLLRPGPIAVADLEVMVGPIRRQLAGQATGALPSPGLLPRHYAPRTPIELFPSRAAVEARATELQVAGESFGAMVVGGGLTGAVNMPADAAGYAARLYDVLHELDSRRLSRVLIELPPNTEEWLAVRDRLTRAAR